MLTLNTTYTSADALRIHNGLDVPTTFSSLCSQANSRQLQTKMKPGVSKANIRSSIEKLKFSFGRPRVISVVSSLHQVKVSTHN